VMLYKCEYSPLCDTDRELYLAYLNFYGRYLEYCKNVTEGFAGGVPGTWARDVRVVDLWDTRDVGELRCASGSRPGDGAVGGRVSSVSDEQVGASDGSVRECGDGIPDAAGGVSRDGSHTGRGSAKLGAGLDKGVAGASSGHVGTGVGERGPNYERNKLNRLAQKERKKKRRMIGVDWRIRDGRSSSVTGKSGFWNSCADEKREKLIESKVDMHLAENLRRTREAEARVKELDSPMGVLAEVMKVVKVAGEAAKRSNDQKVVGWVKNVAESYSEQLASSAPSTMKSFESFHDSAASSVPVEIHDDLLEKYKVECERAERAEALLKKLQRKESKEVSAVVDSGSRVVVNVPESTLMKLREELILESRKIEEKYDAMVAYDPVMFQQEKLMLRKKQKYQPLFR